MDKKIFQEALQKHKEIKKRLKEYKKHINDPGFYRPIGIKELREFFQYAPEDIEFLLQRIDSLEQIILRLKLERSYRNGRKGVPAKKVIKSLKAQ